MGIRSVSRLAKPFDRYIANDIQGRKLGPFFDVAAHAVIQPEQSS
jgi:hypothetical protein